MDARRNRGRRCDLSRPYARDRTLDPAFGRTYAPLHILRLPPARARHSVRRAPREHALERSGYVAAQARGVSFGSRRRRLLDAVDQAAGGARIPSRRAVQQPQRGIREVPQPPARAAELHHRPALHAAVDDRGRRHHVRDAGVVVRPRQTAALHARIPRYGRHSRQVPQHRQILLRLLPRLHPRPLSTRLPARVVRQRDDGTGDMRRDSGLRPAPSVDGDLDGTHHAQALRLHHARSVPPHVRFAGRLLGLAARHEELGRVPPRAAAAELYQIFRSHTRGGRYAAASEGGFRRSVALRAARRRHGRGAHAVPHGRGVDAPRLRPRLGTGLVDGIPTQQDVRREGRVAYMLFRPRREPSPHRRHARQSALSHPRRRGRHGVDGVRSRRHIYRRAPLARRLREPLRPAFRAGGALARVG